MKTCKANYKKSQVLETRKCHETQESGHQKHIICSHAPNIPPLKLQNISNDDISPYTYSHPFRFKIKKKLICDKAISHRTNPPGNDYVNFKKAKPLSNRIHPNIIKLDTKKQILYQSMLNSWIDQYQNEDYGFNSCLNYCKIRLFELLKATEKEQSPSTARIAIVCDLFNKLSESPRYKQALSPFKNELFSAIFINFDENLNKNNLNYLKLNTYFVKYKNLKSENEIISKKLSLLQSRLKDKSDLDDTEQDGTAKLIDHILTMWRIDRKKNAFKAWKQYILFKQQRIREICGKYRAFQISKKKIFLRWRNVATQTKNENIEMDVFRYKKHISVIENNLQFYKLKYNDLKQSSSEHIERLLNDLSKWRIKALNDIDEDEQGMMNKNSKLLNKWKRYFCDYFMSLLQSIKDKLDDIINCNIYNDPNIIINEMKNKHITAYSKIKIIQDFNSFSSEDIVLNWINWRLLSTNLSISNFSIDFKSSKSYFVLLNVLYPQLFDLDELLKENNLCLRAEKLIQILNKIDTNINQGPLIYVHDIIEGKADLNFVMIVRLMLLNSGLSIKNKSIFKNEYELLDKTMTRCTKLRRSRKLRDIQQLNRFAIECYDVVNKIEESIKNMRERHTIWINTCSKIAFDAQIYINQRMRGHPRSVNDEIQRAVKKEFAHISAIKLAHILNKYPNPNKELELLKNILTQTTDELQRIFTYYASNSDAGDMNMTQFLTFINDIKVKGKGLSTKRIIKIFEIANLEESDMNTVDAQFINDINDINDPNDLNDTNNDDINDDVNDETMFELFEENPDDTLVGYEFVECLVRIAKRKFINAPTLAKSYQLLLEEHLRKYSCHLNTFTDIINTPEIQNIFTENNTNLKKIFIYYSKLSFKKLQFEIPSNNDWLNLGIRTNEFSSMLKDSRLLDNTLTQQTLDIVLNKIGKTQKGLLNYTQFCQALAAVSCLRNPDPFIPLKVKISVFVTFDLINPLIKGQLIKNAIKR